MSYAVNRANRVTQANAAAEALADHDRLSFLRKLNFAPVQITDWESNFLESTFKRLTQIEGAHVVSFSARERAVIDKMRIDYEGQL